jgi:hypothetical protein
MGNSGVGGHIPGFVAGSSSSLRKREHMSDQGTIETQQPPELSQALQIAAPADAFARIYDPKLDDAERVTVTIANITIAGLADALRVLSALSEIIPIHLMEEAEKIVRARWGFMSTKDEP